ncbi:hypothetical protein ABPG74_002582 [Tetrahymena malaccensis]
MTSIQKEREIISAYYKNKESLKEHGLERFIQEISQPSKNIISEDYIIGEKNQPKRYKTNEVSEIFPNQSNKNSEILQQNEFLQKNIPILQIVDNAQVVNDPNIGILYNQNSIKISSRQNILKKQQTIESPVITLETKEDDQMNGKQEYLFQEQQGKINKHQVNEEKNGEFDSQSIIPKFKSKMKQFLDNDQQSVDCQDNSDNQLYQLNIFDNMQSQSTNPKNQQIKLLQLSQTQSKNEQNEFTMVDSVIEEPIQKYDSIINNDENLQQQPVQQEYEQQTNQKVADHQMEEKKGGEKLNDENEEYGVYQQVVVPSFRSKQKSQIDQDYSCNIPNQISNSNSIEPLKGMESLVSSRTRSVLCKFNSYQQNPTLYINNKEQNLNTLFDSIVENENQKSQASQQNESVQTESQKLFLSPLNKKAQHFFKKTELQQKDESQNKREEINQKQDLKNKLLTIHNTKFSNQIKPLISNLNLSPFESQFAIYQSKFLQQQYNNKFIQRCANNKKQMSILDKKILLSIQKTLNI